MMPHLYAPPPAQFGIQTILCPTCEQERGFLVTHYEWYGWYITCLSCGDEWGDGERLERPFLRGWRAKSVADAVRRIEAALAVPEEVKE